MAKLTNSSLLLQEINILTKHITLNHGNGVMMLIDTFKKCQRVVALANTEDVPINSNDKKQLLFNLFELEEIFIKKLTEADGGNAEERPEKE
jgi:hypothetical protein